MRREISRAVKLGADKIVGLARDLVRIPSENRPPSGDERQVQNYVRRFWEQCGVECDTFDPTDAAGFKSHPGFCELDRTYEGRPVVVARIPGAGGGRSLIFSGHVDVVPVGKGKWRHAAYSGAVEDGRLYGRGAYDMKGAVAAMISAARILREMKVTLKGDLIVETVPDEEFASGNGTVAARARGYTADACVVGEPTGLKVVTGHRGFRLAQAAIVGKTGIPVIGGQMVNPVQHLAPVLRGIENFREMRLAVTKEDTVMITKLAANEFRPDELLTVPEECRIEVYWQVLPEEDIADVDTVFEAAIQNACASESYFEANPLRISYHLRAMPGSRVCADAPIVKDMCTVVESVTGKPAEVLSAFPPCDLFVFNKFSGIPALVFGPGGGNAHAPDEYVFVDDLLACAEVYVNLALTWCGVS